MAVKGYNVISKNLSKLNEGQNTLTSVINGIPKSFTANVENGVVRSINMYPGISNRITTNPIINLGNLTW